MTKTLNYQGFLLGSILVLSACFALFLGYIDEGYYNFNFLLEPGAVFILSIYALFTAIPALLAYGVCKYFKLSGKWTVGICSLAFFVFPFIMFGFMASYSW